MLLVLYAASVATYLFNLILLWFSFIYQIVLPSVMQSKLSFKVGLAVDPVVQCYMDTKIPLEQ